MKSVIVLSLFLLSFSSYARAADPCPRCREMEGIVRSGDLLKAQQYLGYAGREFQLDPIQSLAKEEAMAVVRLCAKFVPLDDEGDMGEFCYDLYSEDRKQNPGDRGPIAAALKALPQAQQKMLRKNFAQVEKVRKNGNGG